MNSDTKKILIIDNDPVARQTLPRLLDTDPATAGKAETADTLQNALDRIHTAEAAGKPYDVILAPMLLKGSERHDVAWRIGAELQDLGNTTTALIATDVASAEETKDSPYERGRDRIYAIAQKPYPPKDLITLITHSAHETSATHRPHCTVTPTSELQTSASLTTPALRE